MALKSNTLYLGDNGRCLCGDHCGATGKATGRDIYGTRLMAVTPEIAREFDVPPRCELPHCDVTASLIHTAA